MAIAHGTPRERLAVASDLLSIFGVSLLGILAPVVSSKTQGELEISWRWLMAGGIFVFWAAILGGILYFFVRLFNFIGEKWKGLQSYRIFLWVALAGLYFACCIAMLNHIREWASATVPVVEYIQGK